MNIKYRPLRAFLLATRTQSFTEAANRLGVTQPSFTALIQDLEETLGVRLFERTTRRHALTHAGEEFLARVERPLGEVEEAYRSVLDLAEAKRGTAVIGALPSTAIALVPLALDSLRRAHPGLHFRIHEAHNDQLIAMLRTNQLDCALAALPSSPAGLAFRPVIEDRFCAVFPLDHALARLTKVGWLDLLRHDLILLSRGSNARTLFDVALMRKSAALPTISPRYDVTNMTTAAQLARRGMGVAVLPYLALHELGLDGLAYRPIGSPLAHRTIGVVFERDRGLSPAGQRFVDHVNAILPEVQRRLLISAPASGMRARSSSDTRRRPVLR